ncbi:unnamed protein product [Haemonchus placei]|uniref:Reverse transcriptase domain-containing protein n=1 Tax=Haemonchus placei TaxID=6290 RepID=A0A0N4X9T2_HAEPC|nr:unnamed protein product [Haemonchus placei]
MLILFAYTHARLGLASKTGVPDKTQQVPSKAQMLSGEALVKYVNENQILFKAKITPASHEVKYKLMDLKFKRQVSEEVVDDDSGIDIDIPERTFNTVEAETVIEALGNKVVPTQYIRVLHDIVLITPTIEQAKRMLAELDSVCGKIGLRLNLTKTMF